MRVDFLIHSEQYANTSGMAVLIRRVTSKSLFSFLTKKSLKLGSLPSRTSTVFPSQRSACPLICDQVRKVFKEFSVTFYTLCSRKVQHWNEFNLSMNVSQTFYIFSDRVWEMRPSLDRFSVNFCHVLSRFYLCERIHDPVTVTWIAFNDNLVGFRIKVFNKQFVCLLFSVCLFITFY